MRIRAGIVLIEDNKVALIERHRAGLHYFVFPGGGVHEGESSEQAAIRETMEELGLEVAIKHKVAEVHLGQKSRQVYFLVEQTGGKFGTGVGDEFTDSDPNNPEEAITSRSGCQLMSCHNMKNISCGCGKTCREIANRRMARRTDCCIRSAQIKATSLASD